MLCACSGAPPPCWAPPPRTTLCGTPARACCTTSGEDVRRRLPYSLKKHVRLRGCGGPKRLCAPWTCTGLMGADAEDKTLLKSPRAPPCCALSPVHVLDRWHVPAAALHVQPRRTASSTCLRACGVCASPHRPYPPHSHAHPHAVLCAHFTLLHAACCAVLRYEPDPDGEFDMPEEPLPVLFTSPRESTPSSSAIRTWHTAHGYISPSWHAAQHAQQLIIGC